MLFKVKNPSRVLNVYEVYYRRNGEKRSVIRNNRAEAERFRNKLRLNKRKFLGMRPVKLVEVE